MPVKADQQPAVELSWKQVMAWRVRRHRLDRRAAQSELIEVVAATCGLHAQLMSSAELTLWNRLEDLDPEAVQRALWNDRSLVKTWAMRGTLHLLPAHEYPLWQAALSAYQHYRKGSWLTYHGVSLAELDAIIDGVRTTLSATGITREQLADRIAAQMDRPKLRELLRSGWGAQLKPASFQGYLCFGPNQGQYVTFVRPDKWLGEWQPAAQAEAALETVRRYLAAYGPATSDDFSRWWGATPAGAKALFADLGAELTPVAVEATHGWMLTPHVAEAVEAAPPGSVRLLPAFDPYVVGASRAATGLLDSRFKARVHRPQGWISPVLLVDGHLDGIWNHEIKGNRVLVQIEPFTEIPAWVKHAAEAEAEKLARFLGGTLELSWQAPT